MRDLRFDHRWHLEKSSRLFGCEDLNLDLMYKCWDTSSDDPDIPFYEFTTLVPRWLLGRCLKRLRSRRNLDQFGSLPESSTYQRGPAQTFQIANKNRGRDFRKTDLDTFEMFCVLCCKLSSV